MRFLYHLTVLSLSLLTYYALHDCCIKQIKIYFFNYILNMLLKISASTSIFKFCKTINSEWRELFLVFLLFIYLQTYDFFCKWQLFNWKRFYIFFVYKLSIKYLNVRDTKYFPTFYRERKRTSLTYHDVCESII